MKSPNDSSPSPFDHRFRARIQSGCLASHVFRVVDANPQEMILWSEWGGGGQGMTWAGPAKQFNAIFQPYKNP